VSSELPPKSLLASFKQDFNQPKEGGTVAASFVINKATDGRFYFHLKAANGQIILSSQMYTAKSSAENGVESVRTNAADDANFERLTDANGKPYFVLKAANAQIIGTSQMYSAPAEMENGIASVKTNAADAALRDATAAS
jgi:hypothetical protein